MEERDKTHEASADPIEESHPGLSGLEMPGFPSPSENVSQDLPSQDTGPQQLPLIVLIQVGLAVFSGMIILIYSVLWMVNQEILFQVLQRVGGIALLFSMAPILLGAYILHISKRRKMPGEIYANVGIWTGVVMSIMTMAIPALFTLRSIFQDPGQGP